MKSLLLLLSLVLILPKSQAQDLSQNDCAIATVQAVGFAQNLRSATITNADLIENLRIVDIYVDLANGDSEASFLANNQNALISLENSYKNIKLNSDHATPQALEKLGDVKKCEKFTTHCSMQYKKVVDFLDYSTKAAPRLVANTYAAIQAMGKYQSAAPNPSAAIDVASFLNSSVRSPTAYDRSVLYQKYQNMDNEARIVAQCIFQ